MSEKERRREDWISIKTPDGRDMIASPVYIRKLLGITKDRENVFIRLERLERKMDRLEAPGRQEEILRLLRKHGKHRKIWIKNRVSNYQWYDLGELLQKDLIVESKSGTITLYSYAVKK